MADVRERASAIHGSAYLGVWGSGEVAKPIAEIYSESRAAHFIAAWTGEAKESIEEELASLAIGEAIEGEDLEMGAPFFMERLK